MPSQNFNRQGEFNQALRRRRRLVLRTAILSAAIAAGTATVRAEDTTGFTTISTSGSTALRSFIIGSAKVDNNGVVSGPASINAGMLDLTPNTTISFNGITYPNHDVDGTPLTPANAQNFWNNGGQALWLAPNTTTGAVTSGTAQAATAIRFEWHEQGSVEGILELVSDQLYSGNINSSSQLTGFSPVSRDPSGANPIWVNYNRFTTSKTLSGFTLGSRGTTAGGQPLAYAGNGQSNVQLAFSDVIASQGFSSGGSAANNSGALGLTPGTVGYGKGNPALVVGASIGGGAPSSPNARQQLVDEGILNAGGRTGGVAGNLTSTTLAVTATSFSANPGTGLTQINQQDAQWLQTAGRLRNGATFNFTTRDAFSGTRNVAALSTGIDPSWASGVNDGGTSTGSENTIGTGITYSNKTSGGSLRTTVANSRLSIGTLSIPDAIGQSTNAASAPIRILAYQDPSSSAYVLPKADNILNGTYVIYQNEQMVTLNSTTTAGAIQGDDANGSVAKFKQNILNATSPNFFPPNTVANPADGLLNAGFILPQFQAVYKQTLGTGPGSTRLASGNPAGVTGYNSTQAGQYLATPQAMNINNNVPASTDASYPTNGTGARYASTVTSPIVNNVQQPTIPQGDVYITAGSYLLGNFNQTGTRDLAGLQTALTAANGLYNNSATASDNAVGQPHGTSIATGDANNTKLSNANLPTPLQGSGSTGFQGQTGALNGAVAATSGGASKGDLIVLGDFNGDGRFDGKDLYIYASGAALSDSTGVASLTNNGTTTFADSVRSNSSVLRKNSALDYLNTNTGGATYDANSNPTNAAGFQRSAARAVVTTVNASQVVPGSATLISTNANGTKNYTLDATGINAFNKFDVNRDGMINRQDAQIVDAFSGKDSASLSDQLSAVLRTDINPAGGSFTDLTTGAILDPTASANSTVSRKPFNITSAVLADGHTAVLRSDFDLIAANLGSVLTKGDTNFDGKVDTIDLTNLINNYGSTSSRWGLGNFDNTPTIGTADLTELINFYGTGTGGGPTGFAALQADPRALALLSQAGLGAVPEPATLGLLSAGAMLVLSRRRRARTSCVS